MHQTPGSPDTTSPLDLTAFQKIFNECLASFFDLKLKEHAFLPNAPLFLEALEHTKKVLLSGGKRIRPYMCYLAYVTEGGTSQEEVLRVGISLELFHLFALVHDDIIDRGVSRHGMSTTHEFVSTRILGDAFQADSRAGDSMALLVGDLIFSWSYGLMTDFKNEDASRIFSHMVSEVVAGQALDVSFTLKSSVETNDILKKNELKTARYTFVNPMLIGCALANNHLHEETYSKLGLALGQAFQIQDDLLDVIGTAHTTGKEPFIDIEEGQHTLLTQYILDHAEETDRNAFRSVFGKKLSPLDRKTLAALFGKTGAIEHARNEGELFLTQAQSYCNELPEIYQPKWSTIIALLRKRVS